jgi:hypothetical protein
VQYVGHSLGAITGTSAVAMANTSLNNPTADALYKIKSGVLANGGGAVANFLLESVQFSPLIKASIMLSSASLADGFKAYVNAQQKCLDANTYATCSAAFAEAYLADLTAKGNTATLTAIEATFTQFAFAAQTIIDASDANNYAAALVAAKTPLHVLAVVGGGLDAAGNTVRADHVIPNQTTRVPLGGTEPLAKLFGAASLRNQAGNYALTGPVISRFIVGEHGSILNPAASAAATTEMQRQVASFVANRGAGIAVTNAAVLKGQ